MVHWCGEVAIVRSVVVVVKSSVEIYGDGVAYAVETFYKVPVVERMKVKGTV